MESQGQLPAPTKEKKLTKIQFNFIKEYVKDWNGTQAAIRAGYAKPSAGITASQLLRKTNIQKALQVLLEKGNEKAIVDVGYVVTALKEVGERCMQRIPVTDKDGEETGEWKFDSSGANKSLELLGRHLKMFTDIVEHGLTDELMEFITEGRKRIDAPIETTAERATP